MGSYCFGMRHGQLSAAADERQQPPDLRADQQRRHHSPDGRQRRRGRCARYLGHNYKPAQSACRCLATRMPSIALASAQMARRWRPPVLTALPGCGIRRQASRLASHLSGTPDASCLPPSAQTAGRWRLALRTPKSCCGTCLRTRSLADRSWATPTGCVLPNSAMMARHWRPGTTTATFSLWDLSREQWLRRSHRSGALRRGQP